MSQNLDIDLALQELSLLSPAGYFVGLHIRQTTALVRFRTYSQDWTDHYTENGYQLRDPLVAWGFSTTGVARWRDIRNCDTFGILRQAALFGLTYGIVISCGPVASRSIAGVARSDREFTDAEMGRIDGIIRTLHDLTQPRGSLTSAQVAALKLLAAGDRHAAAAAKLRISESALKARLNGARNRLSARTTAEAIQRARDFQLM